MSLYPSLPGPRMAYDRDGSVVTSVSQTGSTITIYSTGQMQALNSEGGSGVTNLYYVAILFPQLRDIVAAFAACGNPINLPQSSTDTTNGFDGTWTTGASFTQSTSVSPGWRNNIQTLTYSAVKAVRFHSGDTSWVHLYGSITAGQTPDRLALWHPTLDQALDGDALNWGDIARSTTADLTFRIKNLSSAYTANSVLVSMEALNDTSPTQVSQHTFSQGSGFATTQTLTSIAPSSISPVMTVRRTTSASATLSIWAQRVLAVAASWT